MEFYKYTTAKNGINILKNHEIRFTQPNALNDVYDMFPNLLTKISADTLEILYKEFIESDYLKKTWDEAVQNLNNHSKKYPFFANKKISDSILKITMDSYLQGKTIKQALVEELKKREDELGEKILREFIELSNLNIGVLSLSGINDDNKMWGFYADSHRGVVICFNSSHSYFGDIQEVRYIRNRVKFNINEAFSDKRRSTRNIFCVKSRDWKFENEYRKFGLFRNSKRKTDKNDSYDYPIYLFDIPENAISGVILGNKISKKNSDKFKDIILRKKYNINLQQAKILTGEYKIIIEKILQ